jgi:long-chain acyl-CoA synthetase
LYSGGRIILPNKNNASTDDYINLIEQNLPTSIFMMPSYYVYLIKSKKIGSINFKHLKKMFTGGEFLAKHISENLEKITGVKLMQGYGLTERPLVSANRMEEISKNNSVGIPFQKVELKVDRKNQEGKYGEILCKAPGLFYGYYNNGQVQKNNRKDWFRTGDIGYLDDDGYLWIKGRKNQFFSINNKLIPLIEIEQYLCSIAGISMSCIFNKKKSSSINYLCIYIESYGIDKIKLLEKIKSKFNLFDIDILLKVKKKLPLNCSAKVDRRLLESLDEI